MTKQDLLNLGITLITTDARVFKGEYEYKPGLTKKGYRRVHIGKKEYKLHQLVWIWNVGEIPEGMVIDHIDNKHSEIYDNRLENLQLITNRENSIKDKPNRFVKADLTKPLSFYTSRLNKYEALYKDALFGEDNKLKKYLATCVSKYKGQINFWLKNKNK